MVLDIVCYRRHGHNEGDDPSYTQPQMYKIIDQMRSVRKIYTETLVRRGDISMDEAEAALNEFNTRLQSVLDEVRTVPVPEARAGFARPRVPVDLPGPRDRRRRGDAARDRKGHDERARGLHHSPKLERQFTQRMALLESGEVDWAFGEALAIGSLVKSGSNVRLTGQDTRRGTFSHRHAALIDYENGEPVRPAREHGRTGVLHGA